MKLKKGDNVIVIAGKHKGTKGVLVKVRGTRVVVEGVNKVKRHLPPKTKNEKGSIVEREASLHVSNVMFAGSDGRTRLGKRREAEHMVRFEKKSGKQVAA
ncbi:MAG TPA: 50S ribosomal protein L24 [Candidatus Paceibacterota bacterium]|nr:50S ribosomal protein L24 [Candidatus Paceibacterota bacterium]